jgi:hypothetical protein
MHASVTSRAIPLARTMMHPRPLRLAVAATSGSESLAGEHHPLARRRLQWRATAAILGNWASMTPAREKSLSTADSEDSTGQATQHSQVRSQL